LNQVEQAADFAARRIDFEDDPAHNWIVERGRNRITDLAVG
jgi:hypothetical protein